MRDRAGRGRWRPAPIGAGHHELVAVHVDGDRPGAQKLGRRFKVSGYPTVLLMKPDGSEITRLPERANVLTYLDRFLARPAVVKGLTVPSRA